MYCNILTCLIVIIDENEIRNMCKNNFYEDNQTDPTIYPSESVRIECDCNYLISKSSFQMYLINNMNF